ncbi:putative aspartic peptidase A1 family, aspartic peptidase domain superfamily [Septoria linicola]|nr:putative aspartic peptidase A1 family, aspartic peptidase domain superfamily [Septoria linicola]
MSTPSAPFVLHASGWGGNDGNWSTFEIGVGTPAQSFSVLPFTSNGEVLVPLPEACDSSISDCARSRGVGSRNGVQSGGFQSNQSTTWEQIEIADIGADNLLFPDSTEAALYGLETVSLGLLNTPTLDDQIAGGINSLNFWSGSLGLGASPAKFPNLAEAVATVLDALKSQNLSASNSYGYSAGAAYRNSPGSIVIGGFDRAAFEPSNVSFPATAVGSRSLTTRLKTLVISNTLQGTISPPLESGGYNMTLDSATAQIWLPGSLCDNIANALGLSFDNNTELYFVNSTTRSRLIAAAPQFAFTLAAESRPEMTTNIVLPYAALDLQIGVPYYTSDVSYFPMRRAANESQFVLGHAFLQEAYLVVDWERQNFTLGQSLHRPGVSDDLVTIQPLPLVKKSSSALPIRAIVGIAVGAVIIFALIGAWLWVVRRRKRRQRQTQGVLNDQVQDQSADLGFPLDKKDPATFYEGEAKLAAHDTKLRAELMSSHMHELPSPCKEKSDMIEIDRAELSGIDSAQQLMSNEVYELPGHESAKQMYAEASSSRNEE